jgi:uncharacterized protein (TIGR03437 family)
MSKLNFLRFFSMLFVLTIGTSYLSAANLTAGTSSINLSCTKGTTCTSSGTSTLAISAGTGYFNVTAPSVPWVSVTPMTGLATTTAADNTLTVAASAAWTTLGSGLYTTTITVASQGVTSVSITVKLQVNDATPSLFVKNGNNVLNPINYVSGAASPTMSVTLLSSAGLPIAFTATASSSLTPEGVPAGWLTPATQTGIAYSWGTTISYTASASALGQAQAGDVLTGSVTIAPVGGTPIILPVSITVGAAVATVTSISPAIVPLIPAGSAPGYVTLVLKGNSFVSSTGTQKTKVFIGTNMVSTDNITVLSPNYLIASIPYDSTGGFFKTAGANALVMGVANGASPTAAIGATVPVAVTAAPIINAITSASSFVAPVGAARPTAAPYDIISIFGANFCALCTGSNSVLVGAPDATFGRFPAYLTPDPTVTTPHKITVTFTKPGTPATLLPGYLLFATSTQINVLVPGALSTLVTTGLVNVQVGYDTATPATAANTSAAYGLTYTAVNPGIFTISSNGQGSGAITDASTFALNTQTAAAAATVDTVSIFMTGLGVPDSAGTNVATGSPVYGTNCLAPLGSAGTTLAAPGGYLGTVLTPATVASGPYIPASNYVLPSPAWSSIDGAVMRSAIMQGNYAPCFIHASLPTVTIGGVAANVTYAGFVSDSIAGLYQINAEVPTPTDAPAYAADTPQQYNVVVTMGGASSQAGVTMWIK